MEKGTLYLVLDDLILESFDFNIQFENNQDSVVRKLKKCKNEKEFKQFVLTLDKVDSQENKYLLYIIKPRTFFDETKDFVDFDGKSFFSKEKRVIDFNNDYFRRFFVDWTFFKNLSNIPIKFITKNKFEENKEQIILNKGEGIKFKFGELR